MFNPGEQSGVVSLWAVMVVTAPSSRPFGTGRELRHGRMVQASLIRPSTWGVRAQR